MVTGWGNGQYLGWRFWFGWFSVVNQDLVVWVQGAKRQGFGDARYLIRLVIWVVMGKVCSALLSLAKKTNLLDFSIKTGT